MYSNRKLDIDKHVEECLRKINTETERNLRCLTFAKQYFKIGRFEDARRYTNSYLSVRPNSAEGFSLLGKILEMLDKKEAALQAYTTSLRLDSKQNNLIIKVCELLACNDVEMDQSGAKYFSEMGQNLDPHHPAVFSLKQRIISADNNDPQEITALLLKELEARPTDIKMRVRLLRHLLQYNMIKEAFKHASEIENKDLDIFQGNVTWYETVAEVLVRYQRNVTEPLGWQFWFLSVSVLDRLVAFTLGEHWDNIKTTPEYITTLFNFDQTLARAAQNIADCPDRFLTKEFVAHYRAQLCFHLVTLVYKQAQKDLLTYKDAANITLPLLFSAYHTPPPDVQGHFSHTSDQHKTIAKRWRKEAAFRCSQSGHILKAAAKDRRSIVLEKAAQFSTGRWREQLFKRLFVTRDQQLKMKSSYFVNDANLIEITIMLPESDDLKAYDHEAQFLYPDSLHHYIWLCLNNRLSDVTLGVFDGLAYTVKQLKSCGAETLNVLDLQAFVYCAALCAESHKALNYYNADKPDVLPAGVTQELATLNQIQFFKAAYKMYKNEYDASLDQVRALLVEGIRTVRCVDSTLDVKLLVTLAEAFAERCKRLTKQSEVEANEIRAELYWRAALPLLDKMKNGLAISIPPNKYFAFRTTEMTLGEVCLHVEAGRLFSGVRLMNKKEFEKALRLFEQSKDPYASFHQGHIYKTLAEQKTCLNKESVTSEMRSQNIIMLSKARDCFYLTLDRLREPSVDPRHPLNSQLASEIEKIERLLSRIDPDCANRNECDGMSDENVSSNGSVNDHYVTGYGGTNLSYINGTFVSAHQNHSTPRRADPSSKREARPSPERLDAQLRQMMASKDAAINHILEHNKIMVESHRTLVDELRSFKDAVTNLTATVDELKGVKHSYQELKDIKKSVNELKASIDELDSFKTVTDMVYEMKKEIADLKKDVNKTSQLNEEDIYGLANDYGTDFNNLAAGLYPGYQAATAAARLPGYAPPPMAYPGMYPPMAYAYGGLGMPQAFVAPPEQVLPAVTYAPGLLTGQGLSQAPASLFKDHKMAAVTMTAAASRAPPPVNVVITTSDPLPSSVAAKQPVLSVTIPPQHIKKAHNYQIPLPAGVTQNSPAVLSQPAPTISTQSLLSNVAPPVYSALSNNASLGLQIERSLNDSVKNDSFNRSSSSVEEHDPCPDFKPIIPLPDEVPVTTGEEDEQVLFSERAKMFRFTNKEWKERGVGILKILRNKDTKKIRILMRRDQVHKICANHFLTSDMSLIAKSEKAYHWTANDFADEQLTIEQLCVRFKTPDEAKRFCDAFEAAQKSLEEAQTKPVKVPPKTLDGKAKPAEVKETPAAGTSLGGFVFSSTPTFKPKAETPPPIVPAAPSTVEAPSSPFAGFTFGAAANVKAPPITFPSFKPVTTPSKAVSGGGGDDDTSEDFVPTAEFKPVVPLPELIEVKTGEEGCAVLFESRAKLLRFDTSGPVKEWKERGIGVIKILKDASSVRLLMRRDQVHKVCCNHQLLKSMDFKVMASNSKALTWAAKDFSEGVLQSEAFAIRFKTDELAQAFHKVIKEAQAQLDDSSDDGSNNKHLKTESPAGKTPSSGFGDRFKPVKGSWECKNCYIVNDGKENYCMACDTPKNDAVPKKGGVASGAAFSFGVGGGDQSWGAAFKPKEGSWECKSCYTRNNGSQTNCLACEAARDGSVSKKPPPEGVDLSTGGLKFSFGVPATAAVAPVAAAAAAAAPAAPSAGFGDAFKAKTGTWECKQCYIRNESDVLHCVSCESPKDESVPKKESKPKGVNLETPGQKFTFGLPTATATSSATYSFGQAATPESGAVAPQFSFAPTTATDFSLKAGGVATSTPGDGKNFVFGSPQKHDFEFTPRSPRKSSGGKEEESDNSFVEEECDSYFKPLIPLPDKVDIKTGEEEEEVLYSHRAKLFRFVGGEWKERGLGDIKILRRKDSGKLRVLMRREQIFKICLNHLLTSDVKYLPKGDTTWLFSAPDFSEGAVAHEQFCVRFKTPEIAQEFMKAVNEALKSDKGGEKTDSLTIEANDDDSDAVEVIWETKVTPEEEKEAIRLGLPPKYLAYRQLPDCTCEQCKKDDVYFEDLLEKKSTSSTVVGRGSSSSSSVFGTPTGLETSTNQNAGSETSSTLKNLLAKPSLLVTPKPFIASPAFSASNQSNVFASPTTTASIFGGTKSGTSIFGTPSDPTNKSTAFSFSSASSSIFGGGSGTPTGIFTSATPSPAPKTIFGGTPALSFGTTPAATVVSSASNIFGSTPKAETPSKSGGSIFGGSLSSPGIFGGGNVSSPSIFGGKGVFGGRGGGVSATPTFGTGAVVESGSSAGLKEGDTPVLNCSTGLSFASLAAKVEPNEVPVFVPEAESESKITPFAFLGAGAPVFGAKNNKSQTEDGEENTNEGNEDYDPHYEPIIPLPDAIVVSTGEEEEIVVFNERAKLFRFDATNTEWKERGVGQMKILHHPTNNTYRFLLRREQVHKVVLNQLITADLDLQPMKTSDKAWIWGGYNYTDEEAALEKLAIRFKNCDLAQAFYASVNGVLDKMKQLQALKDKGDENVAIIEDVSSDDHYEEEGHYEDDDDDRSVMFMKRCTLSEEIEGQWLEVAMGDLQVYYDPELFAARICVNDDSGLVVSETLIGMNTEMELNENSCIWRAVEWSSEDMRWRKLKATFSSNVAAQEFHCNYLEGLNYAQECDIVDGIFDTAKEKNEN